MSRTDAHKELFLKHLLNDTELLAVMDALGSTSSDVRIVGGAVRNVIRRIPISDIDIATVHPPGETAQRAELAGFKTVPTGIEHGTVTVIGKQSTFEVTTLREDIKTDGRHAVVQFGKSWQRDMERRDFTMNALSVDRNGTLFDLVDGLQDCINGRVRYIGNADKRVAEDALRMLRFIRFSACFGSGQMDATGLNASNAALSLLQHLSVERIQQELKKLFAAQSAEQLAGVLAEATQILSNVGFDQASMNCEAVRRCGVTGWNARLVSFAGYPSQPLLDLMQNLRFSNMDIGCVKALVAALAFLDEQGLDKTFNLKHGAYLFGLPTFVDAVHVHHAVHPDASGSVNHSLSFLRGWQVPKFPVKGQDLIDLGHMPGPDIGRLLADIEQKWIATEFVASKADLLADIFKEIEI